MSDDFDAQLAQAFNKADAKPDAPAPTKKKKTKRKEKPEPTKPSKKQRVTFADPEAPLPPEVEQAEPVVEKEYEDTMTQLLRYCDAFPEHAGNVRAVATSGRLSLSDLQLELAQLTRKINAQQELSMMRSGLITSCAALEFGSGFIPGQPIKLQGFSSSVSASIESFDICLKQLMCKYGNDFVISIEATLVLMLCKHAVTTHISNAAKEPARAVRSTETSTVDIIDLDVPIKEEPGVSGVPGVESSEVN
jgi:hypothetical protein